MVVLDCHMVTIEVALSLDSLHNNDLRRTHTKSQWYSCSPLLPTSSLGAWSQERRETYTFCRHGRWAANKIATNMPCCSKVVGRYPPRRGWRLGLHVIARRAAFSRPDPKPIYHSPESVESRYGRRESRVCPSWRPSSLTQTQFRPLHAPTTNVNPVNLLFNFISQVSDAASGMLFGARQRLKRSRPSWSPVAVQHAEARVL